MARQGGARRGKARLGKAWQGKARQGKARELAELLKLPISQKKRQNNPNTYKGN